MSKNRHRAAKRAYVPRHVRLTAHLAERIASGEWRSGAAIPIAVQLAATYGVSAWTVRQAVKALVNAGILKSRQGSGTFVIKSEALTAALRVPRDCPTRRQAAIGFAVEHPGHIS